MDIDRPKLLGDDKAVEFRLSLLHDPHVLPLTRFVERLRSRMGQDAAIPYFDPWDGGTEADVLFLLEAPGPKARNSGFVSMNNPDETAKNIFEISHDAGFDRKRVVIWNVVPWYIGSGSRIRPAKTSDIRKGIEPLRELLPLLKKLRAVVLVGKKAQKAKSEIEQLSPNFRVFNSSHPSPMFVNNKPGNRDMLAEDWQTVRAFLDGS